MLNIVSPTDVDRQARWEVSAIQRGVARYREVAATREVHELAPGLRVMTMAAKGVIERIEAMQVEAATPVASAHPSGWHSTFMRNEADTLAVIALTTALRTGVVEKGVARMGSPVMAFAKRAVAAIRDQEDFEAFAEAQKAEKRIANRGVKIARASAARSVAEAREDVLAAEIGAAVAGRLCRLFERTCPSPTRQHWARFAKKHGLARTAARDDERDAATVGGALVSALCVGAPKWFETDLIGLGNARTAHILLTPYAVEQMQDADARAELARPAMRPMIIKPLPWRYVEKEAA